MTDSKIADNDALYYGGGIYASGAACILSMTGTSSISDNDASMMGGGVFLSNTSFTLEKNGTISGNEASMTGGGVYLMGTSAELEVKGEVTNNTASSGGGIYTSSYSYANPVDTAAYSNLSIDDNASFSGNTATDGTYYPPVNYLDVIHFDGELLNNKDVNYEGPYAVTYIANNNISPEENPHYQNADSGQGTEKISVLDNGTTGFTAPSDKPNFIGWNTKADGSGISYDATDTVDIMDNSLVLYAKWEADAVYTADADYYYLEDDGSAIYIDSAALTVTGGAVTIDTTFYNLNTPGYIAWYYTVGPDHDVKYCFKDVGDEYTGIDDDITFKVYAVSTMVDVIVPNDSFFWYANEDTEEQIDVLLDITSGKYTHLNLKGDEPAYEIQSKAYSIQDNGLTPVTVELADFEQDGSRSGIEDLLLSNDDDMLFLNLTGDLAEGLLGQDLLRQESTADPFGGYSESLGAGDSWQYSFGGFYYPETGHLPGTSAISDYKLTFNFELDLSDPDS